MNTAVALGVLEFEELVYLFSEMISRCFNSGKSPLRGHCFSCLCVVGDGCHTDFWSSSVTYALDIRTSYTEKEVHYTPRRRGQGQRLRDFRINSRRRLSHPHLLIWTTHSFNVTPLVSIYTITCTSFSRFTRIFLQNSIRRSIIDL